MQNRVNRARNRRFAFAEGPRALTEMAALLSATPLLLQAPRGAGQPVLVLPGLGAGDRSTRVLREYSQLLGHIPHGWEMGRNLGPGRAGFQTELAARLDEIYQSHDAAPVSIVGWSLGGVYARLLAHRYPQKVRQVITLGSPFAGSSRSTRGYQPLAGDPLPGVPSTAIFSKSDGVVPWQVAVERHTEVAENIEVYSSHIGLGFHPAVLFAIADRLAQPAEGWQPFAPSAWHQWAYGPADLASAADREQPATA